MRIIIIFLLIANTVFCQNIPDLKPNQTINGKKEGAWIFWYNAKWKPTTLKDSVAYYRKITFKEDKPIGIVNDFYKSGQKQWEGKLISVEPEVNEGKCTWYYENGNKSSVVNFVNGLKEGEEISYYENGNIYEKGVNYKGFRFSEWIKFSISGQQGKIQYGMNEISNEFEKIINEFDIKNLDSVISYIEKIEKFNYFKDESSLDVLKVLSYQLKIKGYIDQSIEILKIKLNLSQKYLDKSNYENVESIDDIALRYFQKKDFISSTKYYLNAYEFSKSIIDNNINKNDRHIRILNNLISSLYLSKKLEEGYEYTKDLSEFIMKNINNYKNSDEYYQYLFKLYYYSRMKNDCSNALIYCEQIYSHSINKADFNKKSEELIKAKIYCKELKNIENIYIDYFNNIHKDLEYSILEYIFIEKSLNLGIENNRGKLLEFINIKNNFILDNYPSLAYDAIYFYKGLFLNSNMKIKDELFKIENNDLLSIYNKLNKLYEDVELYKNNLAKEKIKEYTTTLSLFKAKIGFSISKPPIKLLKSNLSDNEVFIDFYDIKGSYYAAILNNKDEVKWVKLDIDKDFINTILTTNKESKINELYSAKNKLLYQKLIQPIESYFTNKQTIIVSPDGILHNIAWQAIPVANGILSEKYHLKLVTSSRSLYIKEKPFTDLSSTIFGGIVYDSNEQLEKVSLQNKTANDEFIASLFRNTTEKGFNFLKGSETESIEISKIVGTKEDYFFSEDKATEENFRKQHKNSNEILLLSTHGFYFPTIKKEKEEEEKESLLENFQTFKNKNSIIDDPMYRSGLALSLANETWLNRTALPAENDGILLAKDIVGLDLSNTKLVVLSACQTALGDINSGEGVFGLQRAFKQAGVEYIVGSLWEVPDNDTKELMVSFFTNLKASKKPTDAMEKARAAMKAKGKSPYQYQGFIVIR